MVALDRSFLSLRFPLGDCMPKVICVKVTGRWSSPRSHELQFLQCFLIFIVPGSRSTHWIFHLLTLRVFSSLAVCIQSDCNQDLVRQDPVCLRNFYRHRSVKIPYSKIKNLDRSLIVKNWSDRSTLKDITSEVDGISFTGLFLLRLSSLPHRCSSWVVAVGIVTQALLFPALSRLSPWALGLFAQGRSRLGLKLSFL